MAHHREFHTLPLSPRETAYLEEVSSSRTGSVLRARRAAMLLKYSKGVPITEIARLFRCGVKNAELWIEKAIQQEVLAARQKAAKGRDLRAITPEMMDWVDEVYFQNPRKFGYACVVWPISLLAQHVRDHCREAGHHALAGVRSAELEQLMVKHRARPKHARQMAATSSVG